MRRWIGLGAAVAVLVTGVVIAWPTPGAAIVLQGRFTDDNNSVHQNGIEAMAAAGITLGCNPPANTHFCPSDDVTRAEAATFLSRALGLPDDGHDYFVDDNGHVLEGGINRIAAAGITAGCNPPQNNRFCPDRNLTRAEFATFITRALSLPHTNHDYFVDDNGHVLENAINAIAAAGITVGCNPPKNDHFCPNRLLTRGETATLLTRALHLPQSPQVIPLSNWSPITCSRDGTKCTVLIDTFEGRFHLVEEGFFQSLPYQSGEKAEFTSGNTVFRLTLDGGSVATTGLGITSSSTQALRKWNAVLTFTGGTHVLVGQWLWNGVVVQTTTATVRAG